MDPEPPAPPAPPVTDLEIADIFPTRRKSDGSGESEINMTRITNNAFSGGIGNEFYAFYAIRKTGDNANKLVRALVMGPNTPAIEFENNTQDYNLYVGNLGQGLDTDNWDYVLQMVFTNGGGLEVYCPEMAQSQVPLSIDDWPVVYKYREPV